jgi:hypothetical protein
MLAAMLLYEGSPLENDERAELKDFFGCGSVLCIGLLWMLIIGEEECSIGGSGGRKDSGGRSAYIGPDGSSPFEWMLPPA